MVTVRQGKLRRFSLCLLFVKVTAVLTTALWYLPIYKADNIPFSSKCTVFFVMFAHLDSITKMEFPIYWTKNSIIQLRIYIVKFWTPPHQILSTSNSLWENLEKSYVDAPVGLAYPPRGNPATVIDLTLSVGR